MPSDQVNMATDLAFCPRCNDGFKVSESIDRDAIDADILQNPPKGAWFRQEVNGTVVGASTRSPVALLLVPFMCVWSGGSLGLVYGTQIVEGEFNLALSLFGIPFLLGGIIFWAFTLIAVWGKVEVSVGYVSSVFVGIGSTGWRRYFDWSSIRTIREERTNIHFQGRIRRGIALEGQRKRLVFGTGLNDERRYFVLNALKYLHAEAR